MSQYFPEPYERFGANVKVELNLTQQGGLPEGATGIGTSAVASKTDLAS